MGTSHECINPAHCVDDCVQIEVSDEDLKCFPEVPLEPQVPCNLDLSHNNNLESVSRTSADNHITPEGKTPHKSLRLPFEPLTRNFKIPKVKHNLISPNRELPKVCNYNISNRLEQPQVAKYIKVVRSTRVEQRSTRIESRSTTLKSRSTTDSNRTDTTNTIHINFCINCGCSYCSLFKRNKVKKFSTIPRLLNLNIPRRTDRIVYKNGC